ncbi:MAG TPA: BON domain-containing protein [Dyella sp.]|uniref:BON domain-containing protein n=1 Tax=Dyella sp. TaxID=1869338 RepID=UPI002BF0057C|nr:BON domain-containing protein [Dyella sp.]HTV86441.1 BON domain-containing protein [Dyella sp.]
MRTLTLLRKSIAAAGAATVFAALPLSPAMAQQGTPQSPAATQQQAPPSMSSQSASSSNETVPGKANDTWITTKVKSKFAAAKGIKAADISVSTTDGAVTLTGTATSTKEKNHAIHLAKQVKGVKSVDATGLNVTSSPSPGAPQP